MIRALESLRDRPVGALVGMRPPRAQHTQREAEALARYANRRRAVAELGVAEGMSAAILRGSMDPAGTLFLIDPYLTRHPVSAAREVARRTVKKVSGARVAWVRSLSHDAAGSWQEPLDFLFIDADHTEQACAEDWHDWSPWIIPGGVVLLHDSALGPASPAEPDWGPVRLVNRLFRNPDAHSPGWELIDEIDSISVIRRQQPAPSTTT